MTKPAAAFHVLVCPFIVGFPWTVSPRTACVNPLRGISCIWVVFFYLNRYAQRRMFHQKISFFEVLDEKMTTHFIRE